VVRPAAPRGHGPGRFAVPSGPVKVRGLAMYEGDGNQAGQNDVTAKRCAASAKACQGLALLFRRGSPAWSALYGFPSQISGMTKRISDIVYLAAGDTVFLEVGFPFAYDGAQTVNNSFGIRMR